MERKQEENTTVFTKKELWLNQASCFNFELDEDELLEKALNCEFVTRVGENQFLVNKQFTPRLPKHEVKLPTTLM